MAKKYTEYKAEIMISYCYKVQNCIWDLRENV